MGSVFDPQGIKTRPVYSLIINSIGLAWYMVPILVMACGRIGVGQNRETDEEYDEDCVEEWFQLDRVKLDRDLKGGREALGVGYCSINIWDVSEQELA